MPNKTLKYALLTAISFSFCISFSSFAKKDSTSAKMDFGNSVIVSAYGQFFPKTYKYWSHIPDILSGDFADVFAISYQRKLYKNLGVGIGYAAWNTNKWMLKNVYTDGQAYNDGPINGNIIRERGMVETIEAYKMFDLYVTYKYNILNKHKIEAGAGVSRAWGINTVIDTVYILPFDNYVIAHEQPASYYGVFAFISYDYLLFHNRVAIGYEFKWRRYFGLYSPQLNYGFNVKFNF
jgi:hypothetical protein